MSGPTTVDLAVGDLVHLLHVYELEGRGYVAAELDVHVLLADALALEGGAVGHRDGHLGDLDLEAAHLDRLLYDLIVRYVGDDVLVGADAGGQDLRDVGVGDGREAVVDGPGGGGVLLVVDLAQRQHEGEHAVLVVAQHLREVTGLRPAEGHGRAGGETQRIDRRGHVLAEGNQAGVPAELDVLLQELLGEMVLPPMLPLMKT